MNKSIIVTTVKELLNAKEEGYDEIIAKGDLARNLYKARNVRKLSYIGATTLTIAIGGLALTPFTGGVSGGLSALAFAPIALTTGLSTTAIIAIVALVSANLSLTALMAIHKDYSIGTKLKVGSIEWETVLTKKTK